MEGSAMSLADVDTLNSEHVQLLADATQPVLVRELTPFAETVIRLGLLQSVSYVCQHSLRECFALVTTPKGRAYVGVWIDQHEKETDPSDATPAEVSAFRGPRLSIVAGTALAV
jgi:hypothetical protein